jgi:hypothetical protein
MLIAFNGFELFTHNTETQQFLGMRVERKKKE